MQTEKNDGASADPPPVERPPYIPGSEPWWWHVPEERKHVTGTDADVDFDDFRWKQCKDRPGLLLYWYSPQELGDRMFEWAGTS